MVEVEVEKTPQVKRPPVGSTAVRGAPANRVEQAAGAIGDTSPVWSIDEKNPWPRAQALEGLAFPSVKGPIIALSQDGRLVAQHRADQPLRIISALDPSNPRECGEPVALFGAKFSPDGKYLASYGNHERFWLWDTASGNEVLKVVVDNGLIRHIEDVAFSPDGSRWPRLSSMAIGSESSIP